MQQRTERGAEHSPQKSARQTLYSQFSRLRGLELGDDDRSDHRVEREWSRQICAKAVVKPAASAARKDNWKAGMKLEKVIETFLGIDDSFVASDRPL
jgi:hypothetical protein